MSFSHPFSIYGLALVLSKEGLDKMEDITSEIFSKYLEDGLNHFRIKTNSNPDTDDTLQFKYLNFQEIINHNIKGDPSKGVYLCPNIITTDEKAKNTWGAVLKLIEQLKNSNLQISLVKNESVTMSILPLTGKINNGKKTQGYSSCTLIEAICFAITNTTINKPYLACREKGGSFTPTTIIPDLDLEEMKTFIKFYTLMLNSGINSNQLLSKKVFKQEGVKPRYSRPLIYNGNFPFAPLNHVFGAVGLLGAIGRWAKEADRIVEGQKVLESLKYRSLYIVQYGNAQSITINHYIIELAKANKLSEIVFAIQKSQIIHPFDEKDPKDAKGRDSRKDIFNLFSSRFLQLFNQSAFQDFLSVRAEYSDQLIELFNTFFIKQMNINPEIVKSAKNLGLWLNYVSYKVGKQESVNEKKPDKLRDFKAKILIELESSVFGARTPATMLNVIVRAGRLSSLDAPAESDVFQEAVLTGELSLNDAKSILMAFARTRSKQEPTSKSTHLDEEASIDQEIDITE